MLGLVLVQSTLQIDAQLSRLYVCNPKILRTLRRATRSPLKIVAVLQLERFPSRGPSLSAK